MKANKMTKTKIAIACQGGGSQTAFTAGVLSSFFENKVHLKKQIVGLSGTSGGAVCASLAWFGLLKAAQGDTTPIQKRIIGFWEDIMAKLPPESYFDKFASEMMRLVGKGVLPHIEMSPDSALSEMFMSSLSSMLPRPFFTDLKAALEAHINFDELPNLVRPDSPVLIVGAADVCSGQLKKFNSRLGEIQVEAILASAAVPTLFPAVQIGGHYYWDGLFSDNPPVKELIRAVYVGVENMPEELWVIQINPTAAKSVPKGPAAIGDRRNQMEGNVSLMQSLEFVEFFNWVLTEKLVDRKAVFAKFGAAPPKPITVRFVHMSPELQSTLDYVSKLSRQPSHIHQLIEDGRKQGRKFLESLSKEGNGKPAVARAKRPAAVKARLAVTGPKRAAKPKVARAKRPASGKAGLVVTASLQVPKPESAPAKAPDEVKAGLAVAAPQQISKPEPTAAKGTAEVKAGLAVAAPQAVPPPVPKSAPKSARTGKS
jgi:NTE family protein